MNYKALYEKLKELIEHVGGIDLKGCNICEQMMKEISALESQLSEPDKELGEWKLPTPYQLGRLIAELHTSNDPQAKLLIDYLKSKINTNN